MSDDKECFVCMDDEQRDWVTLPCGHELHALCAFQCTVRGNTSCGLCREPMMTEYEEPDVVEEYFTAYRPLDTRRLGQCVRRLRRRTDVASRRMLARYDKHRTNLTKFRTELKRERDVEKEMTRSARQHVTNEFDVRNARVRVYNKRVYHLWRKIYNEKKKLKDLSFDILDMI